ncbi:MAG: large subunit ribosomal protein [Patescibacteria group bacterium]|nr:large subunit ribosomal protein [Patescibacteria group bacterium]
MKKNHQTAKQRRNTRSRGLSKGTVDKPRICVFRSNKNIYAQVINDGEGKVLASESSVATEFKGSKSKIALEVGENIGEKLKSLKIESAIFDRNGYRYHGRVKNIAEGIRSKGINL